MKRAILRASFLSTNSSGSKFLTSAAKVVVKPVVSKPVMGPMPLAPAISCRQTSGAVLPTPQTSPSPVITTLRGKLDKGLLAAFRFFCILLDVLDRVLDGLDFFGGLVATLKVRALFKLHYQLDYVQRIRAQVFLEAGAGGDFGFVHLQLLDDD